MSDFFDDVFTAYCNSYNECASCPLGKETGDCRDLFARKMEAWAAKQVEMAAAETTPHATDTNLPRSAKRSVGEDINVPTTLPKWCKKGQWVLMNNNLCKIVEVNGDPYYPLTVKNTHGECAFTHPRVMCPVRFRPYSYEEAKGLLGKTMEYTVKNAIASVYHSMLICKVSSNDNDGDTFIHSCRFSDWVDYEATIDGVPIGVPVVDEDALKEGEK